MNSFDTRDIRRLPDGSIDYSYYAALGHQAKNRQARQVAHSILKLSLRPSRLAPVVVAIISMLAILP
jgi:hypothetical protein